MRADAGCLVGELARAALCEGIEVRGDRARDRARRVAPLWRLLSGIAEAG
ncbi:MAG TPA: hypothetical protein VLJ59_03495 [Mycobacteriales bacterium]|nr:hypothetical protein [Mycobacteriales bacterium]